MPSITDTLLHLLSHRFPRTMGYLGMFPTAYIILWGMMILDIFTGVIKSIAQRSLASSVAKKGMLMKAAILISIALLWLVGVLLSFPLGTWTCGGFCIVEAFSVWENVRPWLGNRFPAIDQIFTRLRSTLLAAPVGLDKPADIPPDKTPDKP